MTSKLTRERIEWLNYAATGLAANGTEMAMSPQDVIALTEYCLTAMDSEPVAVVEPSDYVTAAQLVGEGPARKAVHELYEGALRIGDKLYRHAQPAPVVLDEMLCEFYEVANWPDLVRELVKHVEQLQDSAKRNVKPWEDTFPETLLPAYIDRIKQADDACRAAMLQAAPVRSSIPDGVVTAEHRRVIEMLLSVCGAAFELADDSCQQDVDGEECHVVPSNAFQKLSDALDEIENTLPTEDIDRPDVFLAWSAMPRAALKSLLQAGYSPVIPEGYVMVPKEPTAEMIWAAKHCFTSTPGWDVFKSAYKAMLAAAPQEVKP